VILPKRLEKYGLSMHPEKTKLLELDFRPPRRREAGKPTFDFLGFTFYWGKSRKGKLIAKVKTVRKKLTIQSCGSTVCSARAGEGILPKFAFHLLIEVPNKEKALKGWGDDDYLERLKLLNSEVYTRQVLAEIKMWKRNGNRKGVHRAAMAVEARIFDLSAFVKELKFKFSIWFNKQPGRRGGAVGGTVSECVVGKRRSRAILCGLH